jgi:hypothetical protein|tara:strand:+ start:171 stop:359 length:189 start_codon:yes stop_codon:yes gene_type:complete
MEKEISRDYVKVLSFAGDVSVKTSEVEVQTTTTTTTELTEVETTETAGAETSVLAFAEAVVS